jgi:hypothetical protein
MRNWGAMLTTTHPDSSDPELSVVDTTPAGADPDVLVSFDTPEAADEALDPDAYADEPWSDVDPEAREDGQVSFDTSTPLADVSTHERWLQSALKALVAPDLGVDGKPGARTKAAVERFQKLSPRLGGPKLRVDGDPGPKTIAALEQLTDTRSASPTGPRTSRTTSPTTSAATAAPARASLRRRLSTTSATRPANWRSSKPTRLKSRAARSGRSTRGTTSSCRGAWPSSPARPGPSPPCSPTSRTTRAQGPSFDQWFVANGIDVAHGKYPWKKDEIKKGWHVVVTQPGGEPLRGNPGWQHIRTQPSMIGAFLLAGNDPVLQLGQCVFWRDGFLRRAINKRVGVRADGSPGEPVRNYITSERGLAILVRLHNWMPGHVVTWSNRFIKELQAEHPGLDLTDPDQWNQTLEDAFVKKISDERKRVKSGSYDTYALDLSRVRGSFK